MLKIRLQRTGRINQASYRIIVAEAARAAKTGKVVEVLGTYNPHSKERTLKEDRVKYWLSVGAQATPTMHNMLISLKVISGKKINVLPKKTVAKVEEPAAESPKAETPKEEAAAEEVKEEVAAEEVKA